MGTDKQQSERKASPFSFSVGLWNPSSPSFDPLVRLESLNEETFASLRFPSLLSHYSRRSSWRRENKARRCRPDRSERAGHGTLLFEIRPAESIEINGSVRWHSLVGRRSGSSLRLGSLSIEESLLVSLSNDESVGPINVVSARRLLFFHSSNRTKFATGILPRPDEHPMAPWLSLCSASPDR